MDIYKKNCETTSSTGARSLGWRWGRLKPSCHCDFHDAPPPTFRKKKEGGVTRKKAELPRLRSHLRHQSLTKLRNLAVVFHLEQRI
jgi:hypothetical protein